VSFNNSFEPFSRTAGWRRDSSSRGRPSGCVLGISSDIQTIGSHDQHYTVSRQRDEHESSTEDEGDKYPRGNSNLEKMDGINGLIFDLSNRVLRTLLLYISATRKLEASETFRMSLRGRSAEGRAVRKEPNPHWMPRPEKLGPSERVLADESLTEGQTFARFSKIFKYEFSLDFGWT